MSKAIDNLVWAQEYLDYYIELGGTVKELELKIDAQIRMIDTHMEGNKSAADIENYWMPRYKKLYKALEELKVFVGAEGYLGEGVVDKDWLVMQWGLYLDYYSGEYEDAKWVSCVPFLVAMQTKYKGAVLGEEIEKFVEYVLGKEYVETMVHDYLAEYPCTDPS